jgi:hypothetical protein
VDPLNLLGIGGYLAAAFYGPEDWRITSHYLFAFGSYRGLYIFNWIYRYYAEGTTWHTIEM